METWNPIADEHSFPLRRFRQLLQVPQDAAVAIWRSLLLQELGSWELVCQAEVPNLWGVALRKVCCVVPASWQQHHNITNCVKRLSLVSRSPAHSFCVLEKAAHICSKGVWGMLESTGLRSIFPRKQFHLSLSILAKSVCKNKNFWKYLWFWVLSIRHQEWWIMSLVCHSTKSLKIMWPF